MRLIILIAIGLGLATSAYARKARANIDAALVKKIEQQMVLPPVASSLKDYTRFYAPGRIDGRDVIEGVYLGGHEAVDKTATPVEGVAGAYVMKPGKHLPLIFDGGCGVLEMTFDLRTQTPIVSQAVDVKAPLRNTPPPTAWCHGDA